MAAEEGNDRGASRVGAQETLVRYFIRQLGEHVSGPHDSDHIKAWIRQRKVRPEMEFSTDGVDWAWGYELTDLFPSDHKSRRATRRVRRNTG